MEANQAIWQRIAAKTRGALVWALRRWAFEGGSKNLHAASTKHNKFSTNLYPTVEMIPCSRKASGQVKQGTSMDTKRDHLPCARPVRTAHVKGRNALVQCTTFRKVGTHCGGTIIQWELHV